MPSVQAIQAAGSGWATLHELLVAGEVNYVTGKPESLWSNVLVLPNVEASDHVSLRGRSLEGAVLVGAHLRNADFTGASLSGANFALADLREAKFDCDWIHGGYPGFFPMGYKNKDIICTQLQGADFSNAKLQGATLSGAQLQGASLFKADLEGTALDYAQLQGAVLLGARLEGAELFGARLQGAGLLTARLEGANLDQADLLGANLTWAQLQGALLNDVQLQGASLYNANLEGALLTSDSVWRTLPPSNTNYAFVDRPEPRPKYYGLNCPGSCDWSETSFAALKSLIENSVPAGPRRNQALRQIAILGKPPYVADEASTKAWTDLAKESQGRLAGSYYNTVAEVLKEIGCAADGGSYVINGLMRSAGLIRLGANAVLVNVVRLDGYFRAAHPPQEAQVAAAFLDETRCPGARGLLEETKAILRQIRDRAAAPPAAGTASQ